MCDLDLSQGPLPRRHPCCCPSGLGPRAAYLSVRTETPSRDLLAHIWTGGQAQRCCSGPLVGLPLAVGPLCFPGKFKKDSTRYLQHPEPPEKEEGQNLNKGDSEEEAEYLDPLPLGA